MNRVSLICLLAIICCNCFAQKPRVQWGEDFKMSRGSSDLEVVCADNSGVYLQQGHRAVKNFFVIATTLRYSATLVKLDKNLSEVYRNNFNKELKDKEFEQFFAVKDKLFLLGSHYNRKEKIFDVYGAEVNKSSGELSGNWALIASFQKDEKSDEINYKLALNSDSTNFIVVSLITGKEKNEYQVQEFDKTLKATCKPVTVSNEFDANTYQLEDVIYTTNKKIILVGRMFEYQEGKKKKEKFLDFANYNIRLYDDKGKQQKEINTTIKGKWLSSTKVIQEKNKDLVLVAFYSNTKKAKVIDGMLVQRINPVTGEVVFTSEKEINNSLLTTEGDVSDASDEEDESETKAKKKEKEKANKLKEESEGFSKYMKFRKIMYTADNGLVVLAEKFNTFTFTSSYYSPGVNGGPGTYNSIPQTLYACGDILACKLDTSGNISWLQVFPKLQQEVVSYSTVNSSDPGFYSYFIKGDRPFYAGFAALQSSKSILLFFNDNHQNAKVTQPGQKFKSLKNFGRSDCFVLTIDEQTGKCVRNFFYSNADIPTSMPRLGSVVEKGMYIIGRDVKTFGKTKIAVGKISF
jgi:hypothetical protein